MKPIFFILAVSWGIIFISLNAALNAAVITVSTTEDNAAGSLREAISTANANGEDNVIYLLAGTYYLQGDADEDDNLSGDLDIFNSGKLMIIGAGKSTTIIDGNQADRVLYIISGEISL